MNLHDRLRQLAREIIERRRKQGWKPQEERAQATKLPPGWQVLVNPMPAKLNPTLVRRGMAGADNGLPIERDRAMTEEEKVKLRAFLSDGNDPGDEDRKAGGEKK